MKNIRIGNDFVLVWIITRGGQPEDLSNIIDASLNVRVFTKVKTVPFEITGNSLRIEFTPSICDMLGVYNLVFSYELPDSGLADWQRKCTIDVNAFQIVPSTAMADDITEFSITSDLLIGFKGDKGDSAYEVWLNENQGGTLDDYFEWLRQPATEAGAAVQEQTNLFLSEKETLINDVLEEVERNENGRIQAEGLRVQAENARTQAEANRILAETARQENTALAIQNANDAADRANDSAELADTARLAIQDDLTLKLESIIYSQTEYNEI